MWLNICMICSVCNVPACSFLEDVEFAFIGPCLLSFSRADLEILVLKKYQFHT